MNVARIALLAAMLCLAATTPAPAETVSRVAAVVNGNIITTYQLDQALNAQLAKSAKHSRRRPRSAPCARSCCHA